MDMQQRARIMQVDFKKKQKILEDENDYDIDSLGTPAASQYAAVDPYSGYPATAYAYPPTAPVAGAPPGPTNQAGYPPGYGSSPSTAAYPYDSRRATTPPTTAPAPGSAHYPGYEYGSTAPPGQRNEFSFHLYYY